MTVQAILKEKGEKVYHARPEDTLEEVTRKLETYGVGSLVVLDASGELVGILSERDIVRMIASQGASALSRSTSEVMTREVKTCSPSDTIQKLMEHMTAGRFRHMPVLDGGKVVGVISIGDVVKQRIAEIDMEAQSMRAYIASG